MIKARELLVEIFIPSDSHEDAFTLIGEAWMFFFTRIEATPPPSEEVRSIRSC